MDELYKGKISMLWLQIAILIFAVPSLNCVWGWEEKREVNQNKFILATGETTGWVLPAGILLPFLIKAHDFWTRTGRRQFKYSALQIGLLIPSLQFPVMDYLSQCPSMVVGLDQVIWLMKC